MDRSSSKSGIKYIKYNNLDADVEEIELYLNVWYEHPKPMAKTVSKSIFTKFVMNDDFIADFVSSRFTEEEAKKHYKK